MSQPAVSRQLAALEREVGVALVSRGPRFVTLTPAGAALVEEAESLLPAIDAAERRLRGFAAPKGGAVRIGAVPSAMEGIVPTALSELRAARPHVEIEAREGWSADLARQAARGDIDLAVVSQGEGDGTAGGTRLMRERLLALLPARHPRARARRLALRDLADDPWLVAAEPGGRRAITSAFARAGFSPHIAGSVGWEAAGRLIAIGVGLALAPEGIARRLTSTDAVVGRPLAEDPMRELRLIVSTRRHRTAVERELAGHLREAARSASEASHRPATPPRRPAPG